MIETAETDGARLKYLEGMDNDIRTSTSWSTRCSPTRAWNRARRRDLPAPGAGRAGAPGGGGDRSAAPRGAGRCERARWCLRSWAVGSRPSRAASGLAEPADQCAAACRSSVRISYRVSLERCRVDVEDDGPGVPEAQWELFTPFLRLDDSRTRASGGHGLGLSIVRRIVYWHGGRASIGRSESGRRLLHLAWPRKAVCATAEKLTEIWRLAICKCLRGIPGVAKTYRKASPAGRGGYSPGAKKSFSVGLVCLYSGTRWLVERHSKCPLQRHFAGVG